MALFSLTVTGCRSGDYKGKATDSAVTTLQKAQNFLNGLGLHTYSATSFSTSDDASTGTVTLSGVGGTASSGTFTYSSASGTTVATLNGKAFTQTTGTDAARGIALSAAINASTDPLILGLFTASDNGSGVVTVTAVHKGVAGDAYTLAVTGTGLTRSGATLSGGADGSVDVVVAGATVTTDTTDLTDAAAATAIASAINNDGGDGTSGYASSFVLASASGAVVTLTATVGGVFGDLVTLSTTTATGTSTRSAATLSGGSSTTYTL